MREIFFILFLILTPTYLRIYSLSCYNNCYSYENYNKSYEEWCDKHNLPLSGKCQTNYTDGCIEGHIEIGKKFIYFQTCKNKSPVNFGFSNGKDCTEYSNNEQDNTLYFPFKNITREHMRFKACTCFYTLCNSGL